MQTWDYQTLSFPVDRGAFGNKNFDPQSIDAGIKELGKQGWELVAIVAIAIDGHTDHLVATLKRPRS